MHEHEKSHHLWFHFPQGHWSGHANLILLMEYLFNSRISHLNRVLHIEEFPGFLHSRSPFICGFRGYLIWFFCFNLQIAEVLIIIKIITYGSCSQICILWGMRRKKSSHPLFIKRRCWLSHTRILTLSETAFSVLAGKFSFYSKQIFRSEYTTVCLVIDESN